MKIPASTIRRGVKDLAKILKDVSRKDAEEFLDEFFIGIPNKSIKIVQGYKGMGVQLKWKISLKVKEIKK